MSIYELFLLSLQMTVEAINGYVTQATQMRGVTAGAILVELNCKFHVLDGGSCIIRWLNTYAVCL